MIHTTTIRSELDIYLKKTGLTINQFAEQSKINSGTLSTIINGKRPIAMQQLDRIVSAMGLPEGSYYELYADECFAYPLNWRRLKPFLFRCAELDKLELIQRVIRYMTDNLTYVPLLFDAAEELFNQGKNTAAAIIYEAVAESEKYQHSERLALCHYRLFTISLNQDQELNLRAATKFEGFVERLDEVDQLDALKDLANTYLSLRQWDKVDEMAEEMGKKATIQYNLIFNQTSRFDKDLHKKPKRPLFLYIIYSYLLRSAVCDEQGDYEQALSYVSLYSDLSWVREDSEEALRLKQEFAMLAEINTCLYQLMMGQVEVLPQYINYIELREAEILPALIKIVQAANTYNIDIDNILEKFESQISALAVKQADIGTYTDQVTADRYTRFLSGLSLYYLRNQRYDIGINTLLNSLVSAMEIHNERSILYCVKMFEKFRDVTSIEAKYRYKILISEVPM
ncbi:helix-turn-helix domain-containing protein [Paenibacillus solani]|uniref:helix-turn-helix domain-containing protein n=1 Tax=Paenibacillus solani TaxID=1705565 RepID=UPI003D273A72